MSLPKYNTPEKRVKYNTPEYRGKYNTPKYKEGRRLYAARYSREHREELRVKQLARKEEKHKQMLIYLEEHPCVDCGEKDPIVLQFDHRNPKEKKYNIAIMLDGSRWEKVLLEIEKCDVRCANCHVRKTAKQQGWWKAKGAACAQ